MQIPFLRLRFRAVQIVFRKPKGSTGQFQHRVFSSILPWLEKFTASLGGSVIAVC